jgi:hypothetical protein
MNSINRVGINSQGIENPVSVKGKEDLRPADSSSSAPVPEDSIALSGLAEQIDRVAGLARQSRDERIAQVRQMLGSATYRVPGEDIAGKLIAGNWK